MSNPQRRGRRLSPVQAEEGSFADAVRAAEALPPDGQDEGPDEPPAGLDPTSEAAYSWPLYGPLDHSTVLEADLDSDVGLLARTTVHAQVYAQVYAGLLLHNGAEDPGVFDFAAQWAQHAADTAGERYVPPLVEDPENTP